MILLFICGCGPQKYAYSPALSNVKLKLSLVSSDFERKHAAGADDGVDRETAGTGRLFPRLLEPV